MLTKQSVHIGFLQHFVKLMFFGYHKRQMGHSAKFVLSQAASTTDGFSFFFLLLPDCV